MKSSRSQVPLLVIAALAALVSAGVWIAAYRYLATTTARAVEARDIVRQAADNKAIEQKLAAAYDATAFDRARLGSFFVPSDGVVVFIESLESLGKETGTLASISSIVTEGIDGAVAGSVGSIRAKVDITGSWEGVMRALRLAELMPYNSSIGDVMLDQSSGQSQSKTTKRQWHLTFTMSVSSIVAPHK